MPGSGHVILIWMETEKEKCQGNYIVYLKHKISQNRVLDFVCPTPYQLEAVIHNVQPKDRRERG